MKTWDKIKKVSSSVWEWIKSVVTANDAFVKKYAPIAINVVNWIKEFNTSSNADMVESIIGMLFNKYGNSTKARNIIALVRKWLESELPKVLDGLKLADAVANETTVQGKAAAAQKAISELTDLDEKSTAWATVAKSLMNYISNDGKLSFYESMSVLGMVYELCLNKDEVKL